MRALPLLILLLSGLAVSAGAQGSCPRSGVSTREGQSVLAKLEVAEHVVVAELVAVHKAPAGTYARTDGIDTVTMRVETVYKGTFKPGETLSVYQGRGNDQHATYRERDLGDRFLLYFCAGGRSPALWYVGAWGRSQSLEEAADDLLYLENEAAGRGRTRLSGRVSVHVPVTRDGAGDYVFRPFPGLKVRAVGRERAWETTTLAGGVYELYDLPPGDYRIEVEAPRGWKVTEYSGYGSNDSDDDRIWRVTVKEGRHAFFHVRFDPTNTIRGRVIGLDGQPYGGCEVGLMTPHGPRYSGFVRETTTAPDGTFELTKVPPGEFVVAANPRDRIEGEAPFRTTYAPGVFEREKARLVAVRDGDVIAGVTIRVPEARESITISGKVVSSDGKPVVMAVVFFETDAREEGTEHETHRWTKSDGSYSLTILKGLRGRFGVETTLNPGEFTACPDAARYIAEKGKPFYGEAFTVATATEMLTDKSLTEYRLVVPILSCGREKILSVVKQHGRY